MDVLDTFTFSLGPQHSFWSQGNESRMFIENSFCLGNKVCTYIAKSTKKSTILIE